MSERFHSIAAPLEEAVHAGARTVAECLKAVREHVPDVTEQELVQIARVMAEAGLIDIEVMGTGGQA